MSTHVIDPTLPLRIEYQRLPDTGETRFTLFYDGDNFGFTVRNEHFTKLVHFYRHHFDTVETVEVTR